MMNVIHPAKSCILKVWQQDDGIYLKQEESLIRICPQTETAIRISYTDQEEFCQEQGKEYKKPQKDLFPKRLQNLRQILREMRRLVQTSS